MTVDMLNSAWKSESVQEIARMQGVQPALSSTYRVSNISDYLFLFLKYFICTGHTGKSNFKSWK